MSGLKSCLGKISGFTKEESQTLIESSDKYKLAGMLDIDADTSAILDFHKDLFNELNDLKKQVKLPTEKYTPFSSKEKEAEIEAKYKKKELEKINKDVKTTKEKVVLGKPFKEYTRKNFIEDEIQKLKDDGNYSDQIPLASYESIIGAEFDKRNINEQQGKTIGGEESTTGNVKEAEGENPSASKEIKVKKGTKRINQKIKSPARKKAMKLDVFNPLHVVMKYFIGGGVVAREAVQKFYKGSESEANKRSHLVLSQAKYGKKIAPNFDELAHSLWESNKDITPNATSEDYKNALEDAIQTYSGSVKMAEDLLAANNEVKGTPSEEEINDLHKQAEKKDIVEEVNTISEEIEKLSDNEITKIADSQDNFDKWEEGSDIVSREGKDEFQKSSELQHAEGQYNKAEAELKTAKKAFDAKRKELDQNIIADQEDLFGDRKSKDETSLFDERADTGARDNAIIPFKDRYESAIKEYYKWQEKVKTLEGKEDSQQSLFQKSGATRADIQKVVDKLKKSIPGVKVVIDENLVDNDGKPAAGKWSPKTKTITINPFYAGKDTAIHEYGHILIDAIGYGDKMIQTGIKQLKGSDLWKRIKEAYPELNEEQLGKEVLAEAIGIEGAGIFDKESDKSKFKAVLDYIFGKLKNLLGIDKNVAKTLAKQVISGIGAKEVKASNEEQLQKPKKKIKQLEELTDAELERETSLRFKPYQTNVLKIDLQERKKDLESAHENVDNDTLSDKERESWKQVIEAIRKQEKKEYAQYKDYSDNLKIVNSIVNEGDSIKNKSLDELIDIYNRLQLLGEAAKGTAYDSIRQQIGYKIFTEQKKVLEKNKEFVEQKANNTDLNYKDVLMKNLGHMPEYVPELQTFSKKFEEATFNQIVEANELKTQASKLAKEIIKEKNAKLGIVGKLQSLFSSDSAKYFEYLENPKAVEYEDKDGNTKYTAGYWTEEEAKTKGFSEAQIKFLSFMRKLNDLRNKQLDQIGRNANEEVFKVDKGVAESFKTEGLLQAFSAYLGNGFNYRNVRIEYTNPNTGKTSVDSYSNIEQELIKYSKKGLIEKTKALGLLAYYHNKSKKQLKLGINADQTDNENILEKRASAEFQINPNGLLDNKFLKPRNKDRGYSKDFYKAAMAFIDDYTHTKNMSPLLPYIDSIEFLNQTGFAEHDKKKNVVEWIKDWKEMHLFKNDKIGALGPEVDTALRTLRKATSLAVMAFNIPAAGWNLATGIYNNIRKESLAMQTIGLKRLIGKKGYDQKSMDILNKYHVVSTDIDSNPKLFAGKLFDMLSMGLNRAAEFVIQGSMFMGQLSEEELNSFEYDKDGNLQLKKGVNAKDFEDKMIKYKNRVSDIQGKYAEKDRRNYMNGEFGKAVSQFKVWIPDAWKTRFGERYIDREGKTHQGSWRAFVGQGLVDLRADINEKGLVKAIWNNKDAMSNLKGAMTVAVLLSLKLGGDDDKKKNRAGDSIDKALGNVLMVFDPATLKFTMKNPIASVGTLTRFVDAIQHGFELEFGKAAKDISKALPNNKLITQIPDLLDGED